MVSRVFFSFEIEGEKVGNFYSDLKQVVGSNYEYYESAPIIEVSQPVGYEGAFNHNAFRDCADKYYRKYVVGSKASGIRIQGGKNIRMYGNKFRIEMVCEFEVE